MISQILNSKDLSGKERRESFKKTWVVVLVPVSNWDVFSYHWIITGAQISSPDILKQDH